MSLKGSINTYMNDPETKSEAIITKDFTKTTQFNADHEYNQLIM